MALDHLFDAELQHRPGIAPLVAEGDGVLVGSGDGRVHGPSLAGRLVWTLFEEPGELVCAMSPTLRLDMDDGAEIVVDGRGYAARERPGGHAWRVAATLRFRTDDAGYAWLDGALGLWEGRFDARRGHARYRAYLQVDDKPEGGRVRARK
ncbi:MAG TPA: hypothetical protein VI540_00320 [Gaiellaceae bacterium]|nr:hypothetical protein [Gaiellaceae bacterium]